jgi:ATP-dependent DNA helicase RecG
MLVENAERFGLTQLHQLRGRVGRGEFQSYCILMTGPKLSREGKIRIETLCQTTNGFEIAETDLKLRGPGDLMGTRQSGLADLKLTNLSEDEEILNQVRDRASTLVEIDPNLEMTENEALKTHLMEAFREKTYWTKIS